MKQILKKFSVFVMMGVLAFSLAACGPTKDSSKKQETKVENSASAEKKVEKIKKKRTAKKDKEKNPRKKQPRTLRVPEPQKHQYLRRPEPIHQQPMHRQPIHRPLMHRSHNRILMLRIKS